MKPASPSRRFLASNPGRTASRRARQRFLARLEGLEDRKVLSALNPTAFTSLGTLSTTAGDAYTIDTDALTLTGPGADFSGVLSNGVAVFDFDSVSIATGSTITATGSNPVAILSQDSITVDGTIDASGQDAPYLNNVAVAGGPGGYGGGQWASGTQQPGQGPGGGGAVSEAGAMSNGGGGGGGFGGAGGVGGYSGGTGGSTYGDLLNQLQGGSGGASGIAETSGGTYASPGGGGGGGLELGAVTAIAIDASGIVQSNGGAGAGAAAGASGGGAGGGILLYAPAVYNGGTVSADGGAGGGGGCCGGGGGGGGGILDVVYQTSLGTGVYTADGGTGGSGGGSASGAGVVGVTDFQLVANINASFTASDELLFTGDSTVSSLGVTYDPTSETYTFTANSGETFGTLGGLPDTVTYTPSGNTATLAPNGTTWAALGFTVGTDMTASSGTAIALGGSGAPASNFGTSFDVANSNGGLTALTVDDSDDTASSQTVTIASSGVQFGASGPPQITYGTATFTALTFEASNNGANLVDVLNSPASSSGSAPITLAMGTGTGNSVDVGNRADSVGDVTVTTGTGGSTGLDVDDSSGSGSWVIAMSTTAIGIAGGPTITYSGASLSNLSLEAANNGGNTINVSGTPASLPAGTPVSISAFSGGTNTLNLGDSGDAASGLGSVSFGSGSTAPWDVTIDDSADSSATPTIAISATQLSFTGGPTFDYSSATLDSVTFDTSESEGTVVNVGGTPAANNPLALAMGTPSEAGTNKILLGDVSDPASGLGDITITGPASLTADDQADAGAIPVDISSTSLVIGSSTVAYAGAQLSALTFEAGDQADELNVESSPTTGLGLTPIGLSLGTAPDSSVILGSSTGSAGALGAVTLTTGSGGTIDLTVDDSGDSTGYTSVTLGSSQMEFAAGASIDYGGASLDSLTFAASFDALTTLDVTGTPPLPVSKPLQLNMGTETGNSVSLGVHGLTPASYAAGLGDVTITTQGAGTTSLTVDDSDDPAAALATLASGSLAFGASSTPDFDYSAAGLTRLTFDGSTTANATVDVTESPSTPSGYLGPITLNMGGTTGNAVSVSNPSGALSGLVEVTLTTASGGETGLTINDPANTLAGQAYYFDGGQFSFIPDLSNENNKTALIDYSGAALSSAQFDADALGTTVIVHRTPTGLPATTPLVLNMGTSANNSVALGQSEADALGDVTVNGDMALTIDDSNGYSNWTIDVTSMSTTFTGVGPTFDYSGATLSSLTLALNNNGDNTVNVTGTPSLPAGTAMGIGSFSGSGDVFNLGDATHAASLLGNIDLSPSGDGTATVSIDDAADASGQTIAVTSSSVAFGPSGPTFDYSGQVMASLTLDTSDSGGAVVDVQSSPQQTNDSPPALAAIGLDMGTGPGNTVDLGDATDAASALGNVAVTTGTGGSTELDVDDSAGTGSWVYAVTGMAIGLNGGPTFHYCGATLTGLKLETTGAGGDTVNVTGTPSLPVDNPMQIVLASGTGDAVNLGDATHAAGGLGSVSIGSGDPIDLTIDDSADTVSSPSVTITSAQVLFDGGPTFDIGHAALASLTYDASLQQASLMSITSSPIAASVLLPITLNMGTEVGNAVSLGALDAPAFDLGDVTITTAGTPPDIGTTSLTVDDSADSAGQTVVVGASSLGFNNGPTFTYGGASFLGLVFEAGATGGNSITVTGSPALLAFPTQIVDSAPSDDADAIDVGDGGNPASGLAGDVTVTGPGTTSLTIDDSSSLASSSYYLQDGQFTIGAIPVIDYSHATGLTGLTIQGSSGGDNWNLAGSPAGVTTALDTNPLGGLFDTVTLGSAGLGDAYQVNDVAVHGGGAGATTLVINDASDPDSRTPLLEYDTTTGFSDVTGISDSTFSFNSGVSRVDLVPSAAPDVTTTLTVDFSQGNPLPSGPSSSFHFAGLLGAGNGLVLQGELPGSTPFDSEDYSPTTGQPGSGVITLTQDAATSTLIFGGLTPITDTVPTSDYSFTAPASASLVNLTTGPVVDDYQTNTISSGDDPSAFELVNFANKSYVTLDLTSIANPTYVPPASTPATGLIRLDVRYFGDSTTGQTLYVNGTTAGSTSNVVIGGSGNTVVVQGVTAGGPLEIGINPPAAGDTNSVVIGDGGSLANIQANITLAGPAESTILTVDASSATTSFASMLLDLIDDGTTANLSGVLPGSILAYDPEAIAGDFDLSTGSGADNLSVDFAGGNPFLGQGTVPYTLVYNGGGGGDSLSFLDSSGTTTPIFDSEHYTAFGPNSGTVAFYDGPSPTYQGGVQFSQLTPTTDSTPVTSYTFSPPSSGGTIAVTDDSTAGYTLISDPSPSPSFESVAYTNKTDVTIDATTVRRNNFLLLNNPTAATGQATLAVNLGSGTDTVSVSANPAGVATTIDGGVGSQSITINGSGLAAGTTSSSLAILGGTGPDVMRLNAQGTGTTVALTPATATDPAVATFGTGPDITSMAFLNVGTLQDFATNHAPTLAMPSPLPTIAAVAKVPLVNVPVATFQDADAIENAASYIATINWGDGTAPTTGTITATTTPGQYVISGSHTYGSTGDDTITVTLTDLGGTFSSTLDNAGGAVVPVSTQLDSIAAVGGGTASVSVADLELGSTTALAATAGTSASGELAAFTNANGSTSPGAYSALINWGDGTPVSGATIAADPSITGGFDISGTHNYAAPGTYAGTIELYAVGTGQSLTIPLSATVQPPSVQVPTGLTWSNGVPSGAPTVATVSVPFFLDSPGLDYRGYAASVDYGDGSPTVPATLAPASIPGASAFSVATSGHTYATPGSYPLSVTIRDAAGVIVGTGSATVVITDPPPTPTPTPLPFLSWGRLSPQSDSGVSDGDGITNVTTPTFVGGATPGAIIQVYETPTGSSAAPVPIANAVASAAGAWSATVVSSPLAQGSYQITATATTAGGIASLGLGTVVIDTAPPVITNVVFNRLSGELDVDFQDNLSGMSLTALSNGASYQLSAIPLKNKIPVRKVILPTSVTVIPGATPTSVDEAVIVFNHGKPLNPGHYTIQVLASGIFDIAGNLLSGRFYGSYPSGNGVPGSNYMAQITAFPSRQLAAFPIQAGYASPRRPATSTAKARVAQGSAALRRTTDLVRQAVTPSAGSSQTPASLIDQAIASLAVASPGRRR